MEVSAHITDEERMFPKLSYLMAYFNQDWIHIFDWNGTEPNFQAVVRHFKAKNPPASVEQATGELEKFLASELSEEELHESLSKMDSAYYPMDYGLTYRQWLQEVLTILKEPQNEARAMRIIG